MNGQSDVTAVLQVLLDDDKQFEVRLTGDRVEIGRGSATYTPDVVLDDANGLVSRRHCVITHEHGSWWVEDAASHNGTFLRTGGQLVRLADRARLGAGDVVCIVAAADDAGPTRMWRIRLVDPQATSTVVASPTRSQQSAAVTEPCVRWNPDTVQLEVLGDGEPREVELRPQGYALVAHMAARNADSNGDAVVCSVEELLEAIWGTPEEWDRYHPPTAENVRDIIFDVRKAIEPDRSSPCILENIRGLGYRLHTAPN